MEQEPKFERIFDLAIKYRDEDYKDLRPRIKEEIEDIVGSMVGSK